MRLIAGRHKGRRLAAPEGRGARPTSDRAREAVFSILSSRDVLAGAVVLDAFAGTGALGLEALSRGADKAVFLENHRASLAALKHNIETLGEAGRAVILAADATRPPPAGGHAPCTLAFLDPPYRMGLAAPCLEALAAKGWLAEDAVVVVEIAADEALIPPPGWALSDERVYGAARMMFLVKNSEAVTRTCLDPENCTA